MDQENINEMLTASNQLKAEILNTIKTYAQQADLTVYMVLGVLDDIKGDLRDTLRKAREEGPGPH